MLENSTAYFLYSVGVLLWLLGCGRAPNHNAIPPSSPVVKIEPRDEKLAESILELLRIELRQFSHEHPISVRYGKFKTLTLDRMIKTRESQFMDLESPASLILYCDVVFDKYSTPIQVTILDGPTLQTDWTLSPTQEVLEEHEVESVAVQRPDGLWFDSDGSRTHSLIECQVHHPEFR